MALRVGDFKDSNLSRIVRQFKDFCTEHVGALSPYAGIWIPLLQSRLHVL